MDGLCCVGQVYPHWFLFFLVLCVYLSSFLAFPFASPWVSHVYSLCTICFNLMALYNIISNLLKEKMNIMHITQYVYLIKRIPYPIPIRVRQSRLVVGPLPLPNLVALCCIHMTLFFNQIVQLDDLQSQVPTYFKHRYNCIINPKNSIGVQQKIKYHVKKLKKWLKLL